MTSHIGNVVERPAGLTAGWLTDVLGGEPSPLSPLIASAPGDAIFMTMLQRHCGHVLDTDALAVLPEPTAVEALRAPAKDEAAHVATGEPLWSESWYADFADAAEGFGGWVRLGLIPNQQTAWLHALLCGPHLPTVGVVDFDAPLPIDPWAVHTSTAEFTHRAPDPLRFRITLRGRAQSYADPAALLRGEDGAPTEVNLDLEWATVGTPYQYQVATRYEISCTVPGSVTIDGGHSYRLDAVPGQRDHSWGVRDWWSMDWLRSALHFDDGTHVHAVDIHIPGVPPVGVGYVQNGGAGTELQIIAAQQRFDADGLPLEVTLSVDPGGVTATVDVRGHAALRLVSRDGRISQFPRVWAAVSTADGRHGVGWREWNRNQPSR